MFTQSVQQALDAEREHLRQRIRKLQSRIDAIDALLTPDEASQPELPISGKTEVAGNGSLVGKGLVEAMRTVLASYPSGIMRRDLPERLEAKGFKATGTMPFSSRVSAEVSRQKRMGKIVQKGKRIMLSPEGVTQLKASN